MLPIIAPFLGVRSGVKSGSTFSATADTSGWAIVVSEGVCEVVVFGGGVGVSDVTLTTSGLTIGGSSPGGSFLKPSRKYREPPTALTSNNMLSIFLPAERLRFLPFVTTFENSA